MALIEHKDIGDVWTPQATFTVGGTETDPTNLTVRQQDPAGTETTILNNVLVSGLSPVTTPVAKPSTGVFKLNPGTPLTMAGHWFVKFEGTGTAAAAEQHQVLVDPDEFDSELELWSLVTRAEAKDWLQARQIDTGEDLELDRVINDVSERFMEEADRELKPAAANPATRLFPIMSLPPGEPWYVDGEFQGELGTNRRLVNVGDLASFTQVQIIDRDWTTVLETVALADVTAHPTVRKPWEPVRQLEFQTTVTRLAAGMRVAVLGTWGFPSVPGTVRQAVLDAVAATVGRDVEHYRQDLGVAPQGTEANVVVIGGGAQRLLSMPATTLAVAWALRDPQVG